MTSSSKPEVVAWIWDYRGRYMATTDYNQALELAEPPYPTEVEPLVRLSDYERLQADHERLQVECEELRKDAERYRYLADECCAEWRGEKGPVLVHATPWTCNWRVELDSAIDQAMQEEKK